MGIAGFGNSHLNTPAWKLSQRLNAGRYLATITICDIRSHFGSRANSAQHAFAVAYRVGNNHGRERSFGHAGHLGARRGNLCGLLESILVEVALHHLSPPLARGRKVSLENCGEKSFVGVGTGKVWGSPRRLHTYLKLSNAAIDKRGALQDPF